MDEEEKYSLQWEVSSKYFYDKNYYNWMCNHLTGCKVILEIGCGTGYSTLSLVENGYDVITIEKNKWCLNAAKKLISDQGYYHKVTFIEGDIVLWGVVEDLCTRFDFDAVICWNVGSYWDKNMFRNYIPYLLQYGLTIEQIQSNPESSYAELIIWEACRLASSNNVVCQIVDRGEDVINAKNDTYYKLLKDEFTFNSIVYDNLKADSISLGGRVMITAGKINNETVIDVNFVSVILS